MIKYSMSYVSSFSGSGTQYTKKPECNIILRREHAIAYMNNRYSYFVARLDAIMESNIAKLRHQNSVRPIVPTMRVHLCQRPRPTKIAWHIVIGRLVTFVPYWSHAMACASRVRANPLDGQHQGTTFLEKKALE